MATTETGGEMRGYRLDVGTGAFTPYRVALPATARAVGEAGLHDLGGRPDERLALVRDGAIRWQRPLTDAFPAGFSTSNGWNWTHLAAAGVFAGSVFSRGVRTTTTVDFDLLPDSGSAALDEATGAVLWREVGTVVSCAGQVPLPYEPVRCRVSGREHIVFDPLKITFEDLDVTLEGFDPRTGKTRWAVPAGASEQLAGGLERAAVAGEHTIVARLGSGDRMIDLTDGTVTVPPAGAAFWCLKAAQFDYHQGHVAPAGTPERFRREGGNLATACDATGKPTGYGRPPAGASRAVGAVAGGYAVVATADGFQGIAVG
ncbi:PQQ-like beta-propeller repeat protein [Actinoplanes sp. DH11]|uniref:PQQ-like beta-propeller repeat protein n=1 Tax=Actinoplanes sp. DH11 TaxID=2857011 RepID=UPI001E2D1D17|nr:PQQ-like beta-propeller repeat protein [Actinoplanes sp. DH11]